jgi:plastocyanin
MHGPETLAPMRFPVLVLGSLVGLAAAAPAASAEDAPVVSVLSMAYGSARTEVLTGDTVTWRNDSVRVHTVSAADGSWTSERLALRATYSHRFDAEGTFEYLCQIHPGMRAQVEVRSLLLAAPKDAAAPGKPFQLTGRSALPAGSTVSIEADGGGSVAGATVDASGAFRATVTPRATTTYRAVAGDHASPAVQVLVLDRRIEANGQRRRGRITVGARVLPASAGATVVLQLHLRERFGWWPVREARLDDASRARFRLRSGRPMRARVVLVASDGATPLATSAPFRVR